MDNFGDYGGSFLQGMDPELEAALKKCKTEDERDKVMQEYLQVKVTAAFIAIAFVFVAAVIIGVISYFCR